jgi:predicted ATP-binding protein involved in virulence
MFKDFDISFVDENDEALPIIVLAGVNGSGKTTLLEFIKNISIHTKEYYSLLDEYDDFYIRDDSGEIIGVEPRVLPFEIEEEGQIFNTIHNVGKFSFSPIYFLSGTDDILNIEKEFVKHWYNQVKFHNKRNYEITEVLQKFITEVLYGLDLDFTYSYIDEEDNIFFQNTSDEKFRISKLSTGEQTLLSKVLYLFFKNYKDKIILIDEPELSLHPSWQNRVLKIYENFAINNNCQIIIATHSPHIIGSAKAKYIRLLLKKEDDKVVAIENIERSYGLEFDKILTDIMGVENLRTPDVAKDIRRLWDLLEDEDYESQEYIALYDNLEKLLGSLDKDMVLSRLEIARIKSLNAKSE